MGLLKLFETRSSTVNPKYPRDPALAEMFGAGNVSATGMRVTDDTAMQEAAVHACVKVISEDVAKLPLIVYRRRKDGGKERALEHPLYDVLHVKPNRNQTSFEWRETCQGSILLRGNSVSRIVSENGRGVAELQPLFPDRLRIFKTPSGRRGYEYLTDAGKTDILLADEVLHVPGMSFDGISGMNPIRYHRETIGLNLGMKEFGARYFGSGANSSLVIYHPERLAPEALEELRTSVARKYSGLENAHRPMVLQHGMKAEKISISPEDSQLLDSRKYGRSEIASIFRVPPHKIGDLEKATFSNIEQQSIDYVVDSLMPWLTRWEQAISTQLLSANDRRKGYFVQFLVNGLLRGDAKARSEYYASRFRLGTLSQNDIRKLEDENPIDGGEKYFVSADMVPIDQAGQPQE